MQPSSLSRRRSQNYFPLVQSHAVWRDWKQYENGRPTLGFVLSSGAHYVAACGIVRRCGRLRHFWMQTVQSAATGRVWTRKRSIGTDEREEGALRLDKRPVRCKGHSAAPFLDAKKQVPSRREWNKEVGSRQGGAISFRVTSQGPFAVTVVTEHMRHRR